MYRIHVRHIYTHRGGFHRRNTFDVRRVVGSKFTAMETTLGWRHFHAKETRKMAGSRVVLLVATCDEDVQLWVPVKASVCPRCHAFLHDFLVVLWISCKASDCPQ